MERRGRIPVARFRTQEGKTRSRSRVRDPDYNEQDPETDLFTLLEDNIALKEENKALKVEIEDGKKAQKELEEEKTKICSELDVMKQKQLKNELEIKELAEKFAKISNERSALEKSNKMKNDKIDSLEHDLRTLQAKQKLAAATTTKPAVVVSSAPIASASLSSKLLKIIPTLSSTEMESIVDVAPTATLPITSDLVERLVDEFQTLKNSMNAVELQLYEANEKIAEFIENQHHLEEESETLRTENTNLTKVAKLLTENMKESVETSKKMEAALIKLKQRNDELNAKTRDLTDGQPAAESSSPTTVKAEDEFEQIKEEVENQNRDNNERIVEMKTLLDAAIQKNTNDELNTFKLKVEILEEELRKAIARAEHAESELEKYKNNNANAQQTDALIMPTQPSSYMPPPPPPLPPPLPTKLIYNHSEDVSGGAAVTFSDSIVAYSLQKESRSDKIIGTVKQQLQGAATGLDALVKEFKSGRVTLRRNRRKTRTNEALQEMFQVLESSQKQNRNSKICINMQM